MNDFHKLCYEGNVLNNFLQFKDDITNRLVESLDLFEEVVNSKWFKDTPVVLLLTKPDMLQKELLRGVLFKQYFNSYNGNTIDFIN